MGLSISYTNALINQAPTITDPLPDEVPEYISDPDHSLNYTCGVDTSDFSVSYGAQSNISYVGISGHNAATPEAASIAIYDGLTLVDSVTIKRNHNIMFTFTERSFTDLIIRFFTVPNNFQTTISYIAAGKHLHIETGEQAGYKRLWMTRHLNQKTTTNLQSAPVSTLKKRKALAGNLSLPHQLRDFTEDEWQDFIDFSMEQPFFMKEQVDKPESTYICYDPTHDINAHPQTRELNGVKMKFNAYNGL